MEASDIFSGKKDNSILPDMSESMALDKKFALLKFTWFNHSFIDASSEQGSSHSTDYTQFLIDNWHKLFFALPIYRLDSFSCSL